MPSRHRDGYSNHSSIRAIVRVSRVVRPRGGAQDEDIDAARRERAREGAGEDAVAREGRRRVVLERDDEGAHGCRTVRARGRLFRVRTTRWGGWDARVYVVCLGSVYACQACTVWA